MTTDVIDLNAFQKFSPRLNGLVGEQLIQRFPAHDPEGCFAGELGDHRILQAPTEIHLTDHLLHRRLQGKGEPLLH